LNFRVYRSSAGSGKTFTLVREYLKIALSDPGSFRHLLAVTFTNKAANEMKQRVLHSLGQIARPGAVAGGSSGVPIRNLLMEEMNWSEAQIAERAAAVFRGILHNYSDFSIGTIDAFSHRVIRAFAHDFGIPVSFRVELDNETLLSTGVDMLISKAGEDPPLTDLLVRFLESRMEEEKGWDIDRILTRFARLLLDEEGQIFVHRLHDIPVQDFNRMAQLLNRRIRKFENDLRKPAMEAVRLISQEGLTESSFYQSSKGIARYFLNLAEGHFEKLDPNSYVLTTVEEDKWLSGKASQHERTCLERIKPSLMDQYQQISELTASGKAAWALDRLILSNLYPVAVLNAIDRLLSEYKRRNNLVHISEFNRRISGVVMSESIPFIYERLGERYHHLLIDEFQDTSRLQWMNLVPLVENALAGGYFNLLVGDGKQAIYRWRNGDVEQFSNLPDLPGSDRSALLKQRQKVLRDHFSEAFLERNFRSGREIVEFNNHLFNWITGQLDPALQPVYRSVSQLSQESKPDGYVSLEFLDQREGAEVFAELTVARVKEIVNELLADGFNYRDIAILCRANREAGELARQLVLSGIPVVSAESLLLSFSQEVRFLTGFIRSLTEPTNSILQAALLAYLFRAGKLGKEPPEEFLPGLAGAASPEEWFLDILHRHNLTVDPGRLLTLPVYDLCEELIRFFTLPQNDPYLQFFLDAVLEFSNSGQETLAGFPDWWEARQDKYSLVVPEEMNAVRVMTIHKAKGLQFPVVIHPFATGRVRNTREYLWKELPADDELTLPVACLRTGKLMEQTIFSKSLEEEAARSLLDLVNMLYVVTTRAEERLYVLTCRPPASMEKIRSVPAMLAGFLQSTGEWEEGRIIYSYGVPRPGTGSVKLTTGTIAAEPVTTRNWRSAIRIRRRAPENWTVADPAAATAGGTLMHELLSEIKGHADIGLKIGEFKQSGRIDSETAIKTEKILQEMVSHQVLRPYFDEGIWVRNEPEILTKNGDILRPDRVVRRDGVTALIEYKTGMKLEEHQRQISGYATVLNEMGFGPVEKFLVYLHDPPDIIKV